MLDLDGLMTPSNRLTGHCAFYQTERSVEQIVAKALLAGNSVTPF